MDGCMLLCTSKQTGRTFISLSRQPMAVIESVIMDLLDNPNANQRAYTLRYPDGTRVTWRTGRASSMSPKNDAAFRRYKIAHEV